MHAGVVSQRKESTDTVDGYGRQDLLSTAPWRSTEWFRQRDKQLHLQSVAAWFYVTQLVSHVGTGTCLFEYLGFMAWYTGRIPQ